MSEVRSAALWERGGSVLSPLTVTLQEVEVQEMRLVLALVCEGKGVSRMPQFAAGYLCESLVGWFYNELLPYCNKASEGTISELERLLRRQWERTRKEWQEYAKKHDMEAGEDICGLLLCGDSYIAFGNRPVYVLNRRFNKPRRKNILPLGEGVTFVSGEIGSFLSFYLENGGMKEGITEEELLESLYTENLLDERKLEKRLWELGNAAVESNGGACAGAVILEVEP